MSRTAAHGTKPDTFRYNRTGKHSVRALAMIYDLTGTGDSFDTGVGFSLHLYDDAAAGYVPMPGWVRRFESAVGVYVSPQTRRKLEAADGHSSFSSHSN
jgi:hypothetical protein